MGMFPNNMYIFRLYVKYSLLSTKIDKVGSHGVSLASSEFIHTESSCHVLICHLIPDPPPHVHHLVLKPVLLPTILLDLGVDILHQGVPLHQHVSKGRAGEDSHNL